MNVGELKLRLNGFKDEAPVLLEDITMREVHELRSVSHDRMCEWIEQQIKHVCVLSIKDNRVQQRCAHGKLLSEQCPDCNVLPREHAANPRRA